jgi:hypothetical protein
MEEKMRDVDNIALSLIPSINTVTTPIGASANTSNTKPTRKQKQSAALQLHGLLNSKNVCGCMIRFELTMEEWYTYHSPSPDLQEKLNALELDINHPGQYMNQFMELVDDVLENPADEPHLHLICKKINMLDLDDLKLVITSYLQRDIPFSNIVSFADLYAKLDKERGQYLSNVRSAE